MEDIIAASQTFSALVTKGTTELATKVSSSEENLSLQMVDMNSTSEKFRSDGEKLQAQMLTVFARLTAGQEQAEAARVAQTLATDATFARSKAYCGACLGEIVTKHASNMAAVAKKILSMEARAQRSYAAARRRCVADRAHPARSSSTECGHRRP